MVFKNQTLNPALLGDSTLLLRLMEQTTYALAYMTLEAQNQGLGCCVVGAMMNELTCADINFIKIIKEQFQLPEEYFITAVLTVGYIDDEIKIPRKLRKEFDEVVSLNSFGEKYN